ncbi:MAG: endopeptidase La [Chlorobi bacterium]|nr:endopeptidase La [Chlorobiota bacterium]
MSQRKRSRHIVPVLPLREMVLLPTQRMWVLVGRPASIAAIEYAMEHGHAIAVTMQRTDADIPGFDDLHTVGTLAHIVGIQRAPNNILRVKLSGQQRIRLEPHRSDKSFLMVKAHDYPLEGELSRDALDRLEETMERYALQTGANDQERRQLTAHVGLAKALDTIYPAVWEFTTRLPEKVQAILEAPTAEQQTELAFNLLNEAIAQAEIEEDVIEKVTDTLHQTQRQHFIREQIRALQKELGEDEESLQSSEVERFREAIERAGMPEPVHARALEELDRLRKTFPMSPEYGVIRSYLEWLTALPWSVRSDDNLSIANAQAVLDADHYDLEKPKERIIEYISVLNLTGSMRGQILCFVGPPGVGKTSLAASIARALGRQFVRISLGGVRDEAEIRGHRRTYVGAMPGKIIQAMKRAGTINPVILLDEVDKLGLDFRGDPAAALLEVLDPEQNRAFNDHFLEVDYDLSQVLFIATANVLYDIPAPLLDRMDVIELTSYLDNDKLEIAKRHIIPKQLAQLGLQDIAVEFTDDAILTIVREYTREAGVRNLEREISRILRKVAQRIVSDVASSDTAPNTSVRALPKFRRYVRAHRFTIDTEAVHSMLKAPKFRATHAERTDRIGVALGLAWTSTGGDILPVEATIMPGTEKLLLTGKLGDVMKESAHAALSYVRSNATSFGIEEGFATGKDIHIHVPEGAIPKDGPSAGITMTIALISAARGIPVRCDVAMTGEVTLRGIVLPVGGLNEKLLAAKRNGITTVIVPADNRSDIEELPSHLTSDMTIWYVSSVQETIPLVFRTPLGSVNGSSDGQRTASAHATSR